jgi:hypothetical protein
MSKFKYGNFLTTFSDCPPADYQELDITAYRWIFEDVNDERNFQPVLTQNPQRATGMTDTQKCMGHGLSLFDKLEGALTRYRKLFRKNAEVAKTLGTKVAFLQLEKSDGCGGDMEKGYGHFTFHEYANTDLKIRITGTQTI